MSVTCQQQAAPNAAQLPQHGTLSSSASPCVFSTIRKSGTAAQPSTHTLHGLRLHAERRNCCARAQACMLAATLATQKPLKPGRLPPRKLTKRSGLGYRASLLSQRRHVQRHHLPAVVERHEVRPERVGIQAPAVSSGGAWHQVAGDQHRTLILSQPLWRFLQLLVSQRVS